MGTHGSGAGTLAVTAKGNVALNAGSAPGSYAQIGNGGYQTSGSNGGAIAVGHQIGMSGARLVLHLALELKRRGGGIGAAALCGGGGQGDALIVRVPKS